MKQKHLEILLQKVPQPEAPIPRFEQYTTPASIAADIIFTAYHWGDIKNKTVVDLGCGTGIFAVGAAIMGAKKILGFDIDKKIITLAKQYGKNNSLPIVYKVQDISKVETTCDTVLMNPPFGAQKSNQNADRKFLEKAFEISNYIYSLHLKKTISFLAQMISAMDGEITFQKEYRFPIKSQFEFHEKEVKYYEVILLRTAPHHKIKS